MFAAALDRAEVVRLLLQHGADASLSSTVADRSSVVAPEDRLQQDIRDAQNAKSAATAAAATSGRREIDASSSSPPPRRRPATVRA